MKKCICKGFYQPAHCPVHGNAKNLKIEVLPPKPRISNFWRSVDPDEIPDNGIILLQVVDNQFKNHEFPIAGLVLMNGKVHTTSFVHRPLTPAGDILIRFMDLISTSSEEGDILKYTLSEWSKLDESSYPVACTRSILILEDWGDIS